MHAYIADIHANAVALDAVLADINRRYGDIPCTCLGDIVDYGPAPATCIDMVRGRCDVVLRGNHDDRVCTDHPDGVFSTWTAARLGDAHKRWLRGLPTQHLEGTVIAAHGCPSLDPDETARRYCQLNTYVRLNSSTMETIDSLWHLLEEHACTVAVVGHTHRPFLLQRDRPPLKVTDDTARCAMTPRLLLSVPSVGQPRDGDPRTGYAVIDRRHATLVRLRYDVEKACAGLEEHDAPRLDTLTLLLRTGTLR